MKAPPAYILALDPATATGIAFGKAGGDPRLETQRWRRRPDEPVADVLGRCVYWLNGALSTADVVAVETPPYMPPIVGTEYNGRSNRAVDEFLQRLYGAICGVVRARQIRLIEVAPPTWRKSFGIPATGGREVVKAAAVRQCRLLGWSPADDNQADAAGIFFHAGGLTNPQLMQQPGPLFTAAGVR